MIFRILLSVSLAIVIVYSLTQARKSPLVGLLASITALVGMSMVWLPETATAIAHALGIGRGADLLFYCWVIITFVLLLNLHFKLRRHNDQLTVLVRELAIAEAERLGTGTPHPGIDQIGKSSRVD